MAAERRQQISELYHAARERAPEERSAFLTEACNGDDGLRQEVESLLEFESPSAQFLERPAAGVAVSLTDGSGAVRGAGETDGDGRVAALALAPVEPGTYQLTFDTGAWFSDAGVEAFYPEVAVSFTIAADDHFHVPLLLSRYGYSTYRGS